MYDKAFAFAKEIVVLYKKILNTKKEMVLSKQLLRSGTSIGANIAEANGAISKPEFSAKLSIAYKECLETKYWLSLLKETNYINNNEFDIVFKNTDELSRILFSILKKTRINKEQQQS